ncbi:MAG: acetyl-CoA carboxylase, carboxyltransferase subunit beta [Planctomycetota bacterium]
MAWEPRRKQDMPDGLWMRCDDCGKMIYRKAVEERFNTCPECNAHFYLPARRRVDLLLDPGTFRECDGNLTSTDPLGFQGRVSYLEKLEDAKKSTGLNEAILIGDGALKGHPIVFGVTDSRFIMGSMGSVVGEKVTRAIERATRMKRPLVIVSGSGGGARMYEGILSLMQMAKTSAALARMDEAGGLFISVLTHPTMAGVLASFASLGDLTLSEPKALIGFAGPRVIEQTIRQKLPAGFQTAEFLLEHGMIDKIVARGEMRDQIAKALDYLVVK